MAITRRAQLVLAAALVALAAVASIALTRTTSPAGAAAKTVRIDIRDYKYSKPKIMVKVGTKVTWTNRDMMRHNATTSQKGGPGGPLLDRGNSYTWTATRTGTFKYHCTPHPFMKGTVVVKR